MKRSLNRWFSTLGFPSTPTSGTSSGAISRDIVGGHPLREWSGAGTNSGQRPRRLFRIQGCAGQVPTQWWRPGVSSVTLVWSKRISRWNGIILGDLITKKVGIQKINWCAVWGAFINDNWKHLLGGFFFFFLTLSTQSFWSIHYVKSFNTFRIQTANLACFHMLSVSLWGVAVTEVAWQTKNKTELFGIQNSSTSSVSLDESSLNGQRRTDHLGHVPQNEAEAGAVTWLVTSHTASWCAEATLCPAVLLNVGPGFIPLYGSPSENV